KWFRFQPVQTALCIHRAFNETGLAQHAQVLGHGRLRHTKLTLDLSHRLSGRDQKAQYRAAVRLRNDFEYRFHSLYILCRAYTCQGIFSRAPGDDFSLRMGMHRLDHHVEEWALIVLATPLCSQPQSTGDRWLTASSVGLTWNELTDAMWVGGNRRLC